ncbi:hypothetical protein [Blastopirellula marina]|uniref:DUF488 domain-containing protein n=1 Tax=Blastopirellula marina TaxID=124 RepID=A0A2S8G1V7_9BACT|nr:hypothetical protein [Blastopirellula marina]PQO38432.1 hypothetical protein C5Y98_10250 [Blastopirellula marina]PTL45089.1 hypothetical protein C5Y97_10260 [Blastopirellula marina]
MLSRYTIYRRRPANAPPLPDGIRQDTRFRTKHILRPTQAIVDVYLSGPSNESFGNFRDQYLELLAQRFESDQEAFDALAELARQEDVYLGCSCPTKKNPNVRHCHTWLALEFMTQKYPKLPIHFPLSGD